MQNTTAPQVLNTMLVVGIARYIQDEIYTK
jgi:hypothetical protein